MKTDVEYLTEHVMGGYFCPCAPKPRRAKKQYVPGSGRHVHESDAEMHDCVAKEMTRKIRHDLAYYPLLDLVRQIVVQHQLPAELALLKRNSFVSACQDQLTKALVVISQRRNLHRAKSPAEMARASGVFSPEIIAAEKLYREKAFSWPPVPDTVAAARHLSVG